MPTIRIFDTTLRDGEKSPGTMLTVPEKLRLAVELARLGVDVLEAGFPAASEGQFEAVQKIAQSVSGPTIAALARATNATDFDVAMRALASCARPRLHTFVPVSPFYRKHFLKKDFQETLDLGCKAVQLAKERCDDVEFTLVDAFRAPPEDVVTMAKAVADAGATVINIADTVGYAIPSDIEALFRSIKAALGEPSPVVLSIHCHNDLGLAVANSLAALAAGAGQVHVTVNGIGERAGNTALEELAAALKVRQDHFGIDLSLDSTLIGPTCRLVRRLTGINVQAHKPVVGANAFVCEATVPQLGEASAQPPYQIMDPQQFGLTRAAEPVAKDMAMDAFQAQLRRLGVLVDEKDLEACFEAYRQLAEHKEDLHVSDLENLLDETLLAPPQRYKLLYLNVSAGSISVPHATVQLEIDGQMCQDAGFGQGPVDATFKTICKMTHRFPKLVRYEVHAVTSGTDALGEVHVQLEEDAQTVQGRGVATDIVLGSAKAFINALNKLEQKSKEPSVSEFTEWESWQPRL
ncbi:2-isopropylmalate synthase [Desulfosoma caldarium]|uniref:2-isopropylmalate synthase n=1 Tax=Desulfosoma caldarium TaxID=610254 RepID=A0A3N1VKR8_9BACT|nr:2-isopropylmalate synthase [Desulfosoma caldarium]ROR01598.1 2-isopropylmalate synthase [Desulfosoma caldarium]